MGGLPHLRARLRQPTYIKMPGVPGDTKTNNIYMSQKRTIAIPEDGVIDILKTGSDAERTLIKKLLKDNLPSLDITDRVKSYEDACAVLGIEPITQTQYMIDGTFTPKQLSNPDRTYARHQQDVICEALNEDWEADWNNTDEPKWRSWARHSGSGFRFCDSDFSLLYSSVGSRLEFKTERLSKYFFDQFIDIHKKAL